LPKTKTKTPRKTATRWRRLATRVLDRDGYQCQLCSARGVEAHHITMRSRGGRDTMENLITVCRLCHEDVHAHRVELSGDARTIGTLRGCPNHLRIHWRHL